MLHSTRVKKGTTHRIVGVFTDSAGAGKTGLTAAVRIVRTSDNQFLKNDGTWTSTPSTEYTATEWSPADLPGVYYFPFALPDTIDQYVCRFDGGAAAANRYQYVWLEAVRVDEADMHKVKAALVNRQVQTIADGVVRIKDDDGTTDLVTLTPGVDDVNNPTENILTPS